MHTARFGTGGLDYCETCSTHCVPGDPCDCCFAKMEKRPAASLLAHESLPQVIYGVVIWPSPDDTITGGSVLVDPLDLKMEQKIVGGYIEGINFRSRSDIYGFINEEGKIFGLAYNAPATSLLRREESIDESDYIAGPLLIVGHNPQTGEENVPLPDGILEWIAERI